jgi:hypothetical protein
MNRCCTAIAIVASAMLQGCAPRLSESQVQAIARDAPGVIANHRALSIIESDEWPASIAALDPQAVFVSVDGLYIVTASFFTSQWGVFVPCSPTGFSPTPGGDPEYTHIADGVYSFHGSG